jgi:hypothetical protein
MGETRTFEVTTTHKITVDVDSWALAYGLDANDRDAIGANITGWINNVAREGMALASDVDGTVSAEVIAGPVEITGIQYITTEYAEAHSGCWLEGSRGWTAPGLLVAMAEERGMPLDDDDRKVLEVYMAGDWPAALETLTLPSGEKISKSDIGDFVTDRSDGLATKAEAWLNENVTPDGWSFGWHNGEFYLWSDAQWEEVND